MNLPSPKHCAVSCTVRCVFLLCLTLLSQKTHLVAQDVDHTLEQFERLPDVVTFNAHIRPIMSGTCFACHGPDHESNESGLRLDDFELATLEAIVPGDAEASPVYQRLVDSDDPMPPAEFRHQLSDREKALFEKWIDQGAVYEKHWSFTSINRSKLSPSQANPIDTFIVARLNEKGLRLSPLAEKATLLRRLSLDLIGLPPTPKELAAFLADDSSDAYEKQVERLLGSPHYGERMAAPWLDLVRFSDTVGYHGDQNQRIFPYRDYVIESLNENKPFDQFTLEQLAGDLLDEPNDSQLIATGLIRLNMMTREGGAQPGEYLAKYKADRVRMLGTAWLGATTGCCECHNHKYDPFTAKDFYSLGAFFDDVRQWGVYSEYKYTPNKDLRGFSNDYPFPPEIRSHSRSLEAEIASLEQEADAAVASRTNASNISNEIIETWAKGVAKFVERHPSGWMTATPTTIEVQHDTSIKTLGSDVSVSVDAKQTDTILWTYQASEPLAIRSIELKVLPDDAYGGHVGRGSEGRFAVELSAEHLPSSVKQSNDTNDESSIEIAFAQADRQNPSKFSSGQPPLFLDKVWRSGPARWQLPSDETKMTHTAVYHLEETLTLEPGDELRLRLLTDDIGKFRVSLSPLTRFVAGQPSVSPRLATALSRVRQSEPLSVDQHAAITAAHYRHTVASSLQDSKSLSLRDEILRCRSGYACSMIAQPIESKQLPIARVLPRGDWQDDSGEVVVPAFPEFLTEDHDEEDHTHKHSSKRLTRKDLAEWLTSNENPLVARHYVNRTWKLFFGKGLSNKLDDLGNQGEWPSHPQLLDWLAAEFRSDWDMKRVARLIVTSDTYKQSVAASVSNQSQDLSIVDPQNRLLSHQTPRRLEAEIIRDNALAISGLLNRDFIGGRSVMPYQPEGYYGNLQFPNRSYINDTSFRRYRRGVYMHWQRTFLHPMLVNFDAPSRDECVADRIESNSPQQALTLLNDPTFVEAARALADRLIADLPDANFDTRVQRAFKLATSRNASSQEAEGLRRLYTKQLHQFTSNPDDARQFQAVGVYQPQLDADESDKDIAKRAALAQVCRVILNLHETITRF